MAVIKVLSIFAIFLFIQDNTKATKDDALLSKDVANSFLQRKSRSKRDITEGVSEECCDEQCTFEERAEFSESVGWPRVGEVLCYLNNVLKKSCRCQARTGYVYECGTGANCRVKPCACQGTPKDDKAWEVVKMDYDIPRASLRQVPLSVSTQINNNLKGTASQNLDFTVTKAVTETKSFTHSVGTSISVGAKFKVSVPLIAETEISVTTTVSTDFTWGKETSVTEERSSTFSCAAPAGKYVICKGIITSVMADIPYTMTIRNKVYGCTCTSNGVYQAVHHTHVKEITETHDKVVKK